MHVRGIAPAPRYSVVDLGPQRASFGKDVAEGLEQDEKRLSCRWLYDERGSKLFQKICELDEYYVPRAEAEILAAHAEEIVALSPLEATVVELGSGDGHKTRLILEAFHHLRGRVRYRPVDISRSILEESARVLLADLARLEVEAIAGEYTLALEFLRNEARPRSQLILFLGSNIGNFDRADAGRFLASVRATMKSQDRMLIGIDLRKDRSVIEPAYDDAKGMTARFSINILARINRELGGNFDLGAFAHRAQYQEREGRVLIELESLKEQTVEIAALGSKIHFEAGERIHTEDSYKYSFEEIDALAETAGFEVVQRWTDGEGLFSSNLLRPSW